MMIKVDWCLKSFDDWSRLMFKVNYFQIVVQTNGWSMLSLELLLWLKTLQCFTKGKLLGNADLTLFQPGACIHTGKKGNICTHWAWKVLTNLLYIRNMEWELFLKKLVGVFLWLEVHNNKQWLCRVVWCVGWH